MVLFIKDSIYSELLVIQKFLYNRLFLLLFSIYLEYSGRTLRKRFFYRRFLYRRFLYRRFLYRRFIILLFQRKNRQQFSLVLIRFLSLFLNYIQRRYLRQNYLGRSQLKRSPIILLPRQLPFYQNTLFYVNRAGRDDRLNDTVFLQNSPRLYRF